jgi:hypothetical protein
VRLRLRFGQVIPTTRVVIIGAIGRLPLKLGEIEATEASKVAYIDPNLKNLGHLLGTDGQSIEFENTVGIKEINR